MPLITASAGAYIQSFGTVYDPTVRNGIGQVVVATTGNVRVGQVFSTPNYTIYETLLSFPTQALGEAEIATAVTLLATASTDVDTLGGWHMRAYLFDWGAVATIADWVPSNSLANLPLLATFASSSFPGVGVGFAFTSEPGFASRINPGGPTRIIIASSRAADNAAAPTANNEHLRFQGIGDASPPQLNITTAARTGRVIGRQWLTRPLTRPIARVP